MSVLKRKIAIASNIPQHLQSLEVIQKGEPVLLRMKGHLFKSFSGGEELKSEEKFRRIGGVGQETKKEIMLQ